MLSNTSKISTRQAILLYLTITYSPSVRIVASITAKSAKQAAWLAPLVSVFFLIAIFFMFHKFFTRFKNSSFTEVIHNIVGKLPGKILLILYILWSTMLLAMYVRYYAERLVTSAYPSIDIRFFIIVLLVVVVIVLRSGIVVISRMNEIILPLLTLVFFILIILVLPELHIKNLTPLSYKDIVPVLKASTGVTGIWIYITLIFFIGHEINDKENLFKKGKKTTLFLFSITTLIILTSVGTLGYSIIERTPLTFLATVKQISTFNTIQRVESILVCTWIISDFILISVFTYIILKMFKSLFGFSKITPFISVFLAFIYFLSLILTKRSFELQEFSDQIALPLNIFFGFVIPFIIFCIGKVRKLI